MLYQGFLTGPISIIHTLDLGQGHVAFIQNGQKIIRKKINQRKGFFSRFSSGKYAGIIFDSGTIPKFNHHFDIKICTLLQTLGFQEFVIVSQLIQSLGQFNTNFLNDPQSRFLIGYKMLGRKNSCRLQGLPYLSGKMIELGNGFHIRTKEFNADTGIFICRKHFNHIPADTDIAPFQHLIIAGIMNIDQLGHKIAAIHRFTPFHHHRTLAVLIRGSNPVNTGYGTDYNHILPGHERTGSLQTQFINLFIYRGVLFNVSVCYRQVGFRLVIVVIADKIFHCIMGEKLFEFTVKLGSQSFVVGHDQCWPLYFLDHIGHGVGFPGSGHSQKGLVFFAAVQTTNQFGDGLGLIALRRKIRDDFKLCHIV